MIIAIRKEPSGFIYIDKEICSRTTKQIDGVSGEEITVPLFRPYELKQPPYNYTTIEVADEYADCIGADFNDDLTFSVEKYNARKEKESQVNYEEQIVELIRKKYNVNQELAILRQRDTKPEEFSLYNDYVEQCKAEVKAKL